LDGPDDPLLDVFPNEPEPCPGFRGIDDNQANDPPHQSKLPSSVESASLFQSIESSQSSESESDSDPDLEKVNIDWATLMLELDNLRISAREGGGKSKIKKGKANGVVLETPEMRKIKDKIGKVEKEYRFSRKKAGS